MVHRLRSERTVRRRDGMGHGRHTRPFVPRAVRRPRCPTDGRRRRARARPSGFRRLFGRLVERDSGASWRWSWPWSPCSSFHRPTPIRTPRGCSSSSSSWRISARRRTRARSDSPPSTTGWPVCVRSGCGRPTGSRASRPSSARWSSSTTRPGSGSTPSSSSGRRPARSWASCRPMRRSWPTTSPATPVASTAWAGRSSSRRCSAGTSPMRVSDRPVCASSSTPNAPISSSSRRSGTVCGGSRRASPNRSAPLRPPAPGSRRNCSMSRRPTTAMTPSSPR